MYAQVLFIVLQMGAATSYMPLYHYIHLSPQRLKQECVPAPPCAPTITGSKDIHLHPAIRSRPDVRIATGYLKILRADIRRYDRRRMSRRHVSGRMSEKIIRLDRIFFIDIRYHAIRHYLLEDKISIHLYS